MKKKPFIITIAMLIIIIISQVLGHFNFKKKTPPGCYTQLEDNMNINMKKVKINSLVINPNHVQSIIS